MHDLMIHNYELKKIVESYIHKYHKYLELERMKDQIFL